MFPRFPPAPPKARTVNGITLRCGKSDLPRHARLFECSRRPRSVDQRCFRLCCSEARYGFIERPGFRTQNGRLNIFHRDWMKVREGAGKCLMCAAAIVLWILFTTWANG